MYETDLGADVNKKSTYKFISPLHSAVTSNRTLNYASFFKQTTFETENFFNIIECLLNNGAKVSTLNGSGETVFETFVNNIEAHSDFESWNTLERVSLILLENFNVNSRDESDNNFNILKLIKSTNCKNFMTQRISSHIAKLHFLGLPVDDKILTYFSSKINLKNFFSDCHSELEKMNNFIVNNCPFKFRNFLMFNKNGVKIDAKNNEFIKVFEHKIKLYPIYGKMLQNNFKKSIVNEGISLKRSSDDMNRSVAEAKKIKATRDN